MATDEAGGQTETEAQTESEDGSNSSTTPEESDGVPDEGAAGDDSPDADGVQDSLAGEEDAATEGQDSLAGEEDAATEGQDSSGQQGQQGPSATLAVGGSRGLGASARRFIRALPARLGGVQLPLIHQPPRQSEKTKQKIEQATRLAPAAHHARMRATTLRLGHQLRRSQVEVVHRVEWTASALHRHLDRRANAIVRDAEGYVPAIRAVFQATKNAITDAARTHSAAVRSSGTGNSGDIRQAREDARRSLATSLLNESAAMRVAAAAVRTEHTQLVSEITGRLTAVGRTGTDPGAGSTGAGAAQAAPAQGTDNEAGSPIEREGERIVTQLNSSGDTSLIRYQNFRCAEHTPARAEDKQAAMVRGANQRAASLQEPSQVTHWTQVLLGLADPVVSRAGDTSSNNTRASQGETLDEEQLVENARAAALAAIDGAKVKAHEKLDQQRDQTIKSLRKAARTARKALRAQAAQADNGMRSLAPAFADAWRELAVQARTLLPPGTFLNSNDLLPKLEALEGAARDLKGQQLSAAGDQDAQSRKSAEDAIKKYHQSFGDIVQGSRRSTAGAVVAARMDFATSEFAFTQRMSEGTTTALRLAREHAEAAVQRMAQAPGGVEKHGKEFVQKQVRKNYEGQVQQFVAFYSRNVGSLFRELNQGLFVQIRQAAETEISDRAQALDDAMPTTSTGGWVASAVLGGGVGLLIYAIATDADENSVISHIGKVPNQGRAALETKFNSTYGNLRSRLDDALSEQEASTAKALLRGTTEGNLEAAGLAIENEKSWWGINAAARDDVLRGLNGSELIALRQTHGSEAAVEKMTAGLDPTDVSMDEDYLDQVRAARLAADVGRRFEQSRHRGNDTSVSAASQLQQDARQAIAGDYYAQFVTQRQADGMLTEVYREHAAQQEVATARSRGETVSIDSARESQRNVAPDVLRDRFADWATRRISYEVPVQSGRDGYGGGGQSTQTVTHELSGEASQAIRDVIQQDANAADAEQRSDSAWQSVAAYHVSTAEREGLSDNRATALTRAVRNPGLDQSFQQWNNSRSELAAASAARPVDQARIDEAQWHLNQAFARYQSLRATHERRMTGLAGQLGERNLEGPQAGSQAVGQRLGALFEQENSTYGREYGQSLASRGRADLFTASMVASGGYADGTNEELLDLAWQGRTRQEVASANRRYQTDPNVSRVDWDGQHYGTLQARVRAEVSGDLEMKLQERMGGEPVTEADRVQLGLMRYQHQRVQGTGGIAQLTMQDTPELRGLEQSRNAMLDALRSDEALRDVDPLLGADGMLTPQAFEALDQRDRRRMAEQRHQAYLDATNPNPTPVTAPSNTEMRQQLSGGLPDNLTTLSFRLGLAANNYQAEVDRQEAVIMTGIQIVGIALSVALMLIPGVNVVAAGILAAVLTGVATVLAKQGMRGERYGWEEMAQDIAMTAVEAGTAWAGGRLAARAAGAAKVASATAKAAGATQAQISRRALQVSVRHALARGAATQGFSGLATRAMDDETWKDGTLKGIQRSLLAGARGAVVGAVTEGLSTRLGHGLQQQISGENVRRTVGAAAEGTEAAVARSASSASRIGGRAASAVGRPSLLRTGLAEGAVGALGGVTGELAGAGFDHLTGSAHMNGQMLLQHLGKTIAREMLTGMARGAIQARNSARYEDTRQRLLDRGEAVSKTELARLKRYAQSAGRNDDDGPEGFLSFQQDLDSAQVRRRRLVSALPTTMQPHVDGLPISALEQVHGFVQKPAQGSERLGFLAEMRTRGVKDLRSFSTELNSAARQASQQRSQQANSLRQARRTILSALPTHLRAAVAEQIGNLPPDAVTAWAAATARGEPLSLGERAQLIRQARANNPDIDGRSLLNELNTAMNAGRVAQDNFRQSRRAFISGLPEETRRSVAALPPHSMQRMLHMAESGDAGTPHQRATLVRALANARPDSDTSLVLRALDAAVAETHRGWEAQRVSRLADRADDLVDLPEPLRGPLAALPDEGIAFVRELQRQDRMPTPHEFVGLLRLAHTDAPELNAGRLRRAIGDSVRHTRRMAVVDHQAQRALRRELLSGVSPDQRRQLVDIPILQVDAAELATHTGVADTDAAVVTVAGRQMVLIREGADARVLHEQASRLLVARDPDWSSSARLLDESRLANWPERPMAERLATWRAKVGLEVESHRRLLAGLEAEAAAASSDAVRGELQNRAAEARQTLTELQRRHSELNGIRAPQRLAISLGVARPPEILSSPPRRISVGSPESALRPAIEAPRRLAARLREVEVQAARPVQVGGQRWELGVDAAGNPALDANGRRRGYGIAYGYEVRFFSDGVAQIRIPIHLEAGAGVDSAGLARVRRNAQRGVDQYYAGRHHISGPNGQSFKLRVEVDFVDTPSEAKLQVKVKRGNGPAFQNQWFVDGNPTTHAHELSHQLGLVDEYVDHGPHGFKAESRATPASPGVFTDQGLMGNYWTSTVVDGVTVTSVDPATQVRPRYIAGINADINQARAAATVVAGPAPPSPHLSTELSAPAGPRPTDQAAEPGVRQLSESWTRAEQHLQNADFSDVGTNNPAGHVSDRLVHPKMLSELQSGARLVIHSEPPSAEIIALAKEQAGGRTPRDYPGVVVREEGPDGAVYRMYGISGETWLTHTVFMLVHGQVPRHSVELAAALDPRSFVRAQLRATLADQAFDSVVLGPVGIMRDALRFELIMPELRRQHLNAQAKIILAEVARLRSPEARDQAEAGISTIAAGVQEALASANEVTLRADLQRLLGKLAHPSTRADALSSILDLDEFARSPLRPVIDHALAVEITRANEIDWPALRRLATEEPQQFLDGIREWKELSGTAGRIRNALARAQKDPPVPRKGPLPGVPHSIVEVGGPLRHLVFTLHGRKHLLIHIADTHGDLTYHAIAHVLEQNPWLPLVGMYGTTGAVQGPTGEGPQLGDVVFPNSVRSESGTTRLPISNLFGSPERLATTGASEGGLNGNLFGFNSLPPHALHLTLQDMSGRLSRLGLGPQDSMRVIQDAHARLVAFRGEGGGIQALLRAAELTGLATDAQHIQQLLAQPSPRPKLIVMGSPLLSLESSHRLIQLAGGGRDVLLTLDGAGLILPPSLAADQPRLAGLQTEHGTVSTLLQEHHSALEVFLAQGVRSVDMEAWHLTMAVMDHAQKTGHQPTLGIVLRVSDVTTSPKEGAQQEKLRGEEAKTANARRLRRVGVLLGQLGLLGRSR